MLDRLTAGDSLNFATTVPGYAASAGWVLRYRLMPRAAGSAITIVATPEGEDHRITVAAATTAAWVAGAYAWASWVERTTDVFTVGTGQLEVLPNPRTAGSGYDARTVAERTLADLEAAFATWSTTSGRIQQYTIDGRTMEFRAVEDIIKQIDWWRSRVDGERAAQDLARGLRPRNRILTRFVRPT